MHRFFHFLALVALLVAPLAASAAAMMPDTVAADCTTMDMTAAEHSTPADQHRAGEACCIAIPPAIDPPLVAVDTDVRIEHLAFVAADSPFRLGAGPKAEDPPPRTA